MADDTPGVIEALGRLRNTRYHDRPVSLYGGMVELPLIVTRDDGVRPAPVAADRDLPSSGRLWAERDADLRVDTQRSMSSRPPPAPSSPPPRPSSAPAATTPPCSGPAVEYAKAVETELNALLFPRLRKRLEGAAPKDREVTADGRRLDLGKLVSHQSLGTILYLLENEAIVARFLGGVFSSADAGWLRSNAPRELRGIVDLRNPAAHSESVSRERVEKVRGLVMGVGCEGALVRLAKAKRAGDPLVAPGPSRHGIPG